MKAEETYKFDPNIRSFQPKSKVDPFECHNFKEATDHETSFTIGPDKHTAEKRTLLLVIFAVPEPLSFCNTFSTNSTIYSDPGTK